MKNNQIKILLLVIILVASFLRIYKIAEIPASLSWDEAAVGYNAWSIANFGKDEWGKQFPLIFHSFLDDKHPVHIYFTAISVKILGLSEFSTRLPSATFGILNVIVFFYLVSTLFKSKAAGLWGAFVMAISPYAIHYSRFNHELNFVLFFYMLGLLLFYKALEGKRKLLPYSLLSFGLAFISYHSAIIIVPLSLLLLIILYGKDLVKFKGKLLYCLPVLVLFAGILISTPELFGGARIKQTSFGEDQIKEDKLYKQTKNEFLGMADLFFENYKKHFSIDYLFIKGDQNPRLAPHNFGQFYILDSVFLLLGIAFLVKKERKKAAFLIFLLLISPIPSAFVNEAPQSARAGFMLVSFDLIIAFGLYKLSSIIKNIKLKFSFGVLVILIYLASLGKFFGFYLNGYNEKNAIEFQYGMKKIVNFVKDHPEYQKVYVTDVRSQPYIFFLYYLQIPPDQFIKSAEYNHTQSKSYNLINSFDRFQFGGWDVIESRPIPGNLYIIEDSKYNGLRYIQQFGVDKLIRFPDQSNAFYLVSRL